MTSACNIANEALLKSERNADDITYMRDKIDTIDERGIRTDATMNEMSKRQQEHIEHQKEFNKTHLDLHSKHDFKVMVMWRAFKISGIGIAGLVVAFWKKIAILFGIAL